MHDSSIAITLDYNCAFIVEILSFLEYNSSIHYRPPTSMLQRIDFLTLAWFDEEILRCIPSIDIGSNKFVYKWTGCGGCWLYESIGPPQNIRRYLRIRIENQWHFKQAHCWSWFEIQSSIIGMNADILTFTDSHSFLLANQMFNVSQFWLYRWYILQYSSYGRINVDNIPIYVINLWLAEKTCVIFWVEWICWRIWDFTRSHSSMRCNFDLRSWKESLRGEGRSDFMKLTWLSVEVC